MSQGFTPPIGFIPLYIRLPFLWRILGKQFLLVARKAQPCDEAERGKPSIHFDMT
jgi:hypothetical protein